MSIVNLLNLTQKAEVKLAKVSLGDDKELTLKHIQTYLKKKTEVEILGTYQYKSLTLYLFGFTKGKAGTENKHELPPPHDITLAFGDIILVASKSDTSFANPVSFKVDDYEQFYSKAFGGFEDIDDEDEDEDGEEAYDEDEDVDVNDNVDVEVEDELNTFEAVYESEEEIIEVKKEKKKKSSTQAIQISKYVHPDKQLNESSIKNEIRLNTIQVIEKLFQKFLTKKECEQLEYEIYKQSLSQAMNQHITRDWSIDLYKNLYKCIARKVIGNLNSNSYIQNKELFDKYKENKISLSEICSMDHYTLYESKWKEMIEHQALVEKRRLEGNKSMATDQFLCTRCFKRECTYYEMQTRSADEPMTIFINCLNCGKNWRQ